MCLPKEKGGLDIKDINTFNLALLGKWKWHLLQHQGELWARVLESRYGGWRGLDEAGRTSHESVWWRNLKRALHHSHQGRVLQDGFRWKVGVGDRIKFWEDGWICHCGDADGRVSAIGIRYYIEGLGLPLKSRWRTWYNDNQVHAINLPNLRTFF